MGFSVARVTRALHSPPYRKLRAALAEARTAAGLTQSDVAKRLRRPQSFVSKYENGERSLDVIEFVSVCRALGADPIEVLTVVAD
jgi:transcriptional regulator with XRE-family HTH domain